MLGCSPAAADERRPQPGSRLAEGHPQGHGLDPGEDGATLWRRGNNTSPATADQRRKPSHRGTPRGAREGKQGTTLTPARPAHTPTPALRTSHSRTHHQPRTHTGRRRPTTSKMINAKLLTTKRRRSRVPADKINGTVLPMTTGFCRAVHLPRGPTKLARC
jgi:hypothetical protein